MCCRRYTVPGITVYVSTLFQWYQKGAGTNVTFQEDSVSGIGNGGRLDTQAPFHGQIQRIRHRLWERACGLLVHRRHIRHVHSLPCLRNVFHYVVHLSLISPFITHLCFQVVLNGLLHLPYRHSDNSICQCVKFLLLSRVKAIQHTNRSSRYRLSPSAFTSMVALIRSRRSYH